MYVSRDRDRITYGLQPDDSKQLRDIMQELVPEWALLFAKKNAEYGGGDEGNASVLGIQGQYADIWRKMSKLKRAMWDGEKLEFEKTEEVISDLIGHLFLTLHMMRIKDEADRVYAYTEDDAAVDAFFRMVGGDPETALKMSGVLNPPFKELVRERAHKMLEDEQAESITREEYDEARARNGAREARRRAREADGSPGEALRRAVSEKDAYGFPSEGFTIEVSGKVDEAFIERLSGADFAESDAEQHGVGYENEVLDVAVGRDKVGPPRIISETVDGRTRYYHEPFPGADREPLALVPKALIDRAQKDQYVLAKEQEAGLRTLADWADNQ